MKAYYYTMTEMALSPVIEYLFIPNKAVINLGLSDGEFANPYDLNVRVDTNPESLEIVQKRIKSFKKGKEKQTNGCFIYNYFGEVDIEEELIEELINLRELYQNLKTTLGKIVDEKTNNLEKLVKNKLNLT